ncbi:hypothetical protein Tco_1185840 [Tanacetum coccineum]
MSSWLAVISDSNLLFQTEESLSSKRQLFLTTAVYHETVVLHSGLPFEILLSGKPLQSSVVCQSTLTAVCPNLFAAVWLDSLHGGLPKPPHGGLVNCLSAVCHYKMAEENVPAPTRTDEQLVPVKARLPIGKSNLLMDLQKMQKNPIFRISVDILQNTNFFRAFTTSADALGITTKDSAHPFVPPPAGDLPWRTILSMINQCLTGKTSGGDRPRHLVLQMLWGVVTRTNVPTKKPKPPVIPYCRFTKSIIYYLRSRHNIHRRPLSLVPITADDYPLGNLKFVSKGGVDEVFGMPIPKDLITDAIRNSEYYKKYLEMASRKPTTMTGEEVEKKKNAPKAEPQPTSELQVEDDEYNLQRGIQMSLEYLQAPIGRVVFREPDPGFIRKLSEVEGKGKDNDDTSANVVHDTSSPADSTNDAEIAADMEQSNSRNDTEILNVVEEQGEEVSNTMALELRTVEFDEGQAGSEPGKTPESRPPPEEDQVGSDPEQSHVAQAGPNPEPMHEDFVATVYPKVHESLKLTTEEQVHIENPPSSTGTLSSMKNLEDAFTFGDQFLNDKSTEAESGKANVETKVESMVTVPIHQASLSVPPLSTPIINLSPPKPVSPPIQEPIITSTTTTTTLPPPPPLQSTIDPDLATRVSALEKKSADFEQKNKLHDKVTQALASRVYKLEHHDLYSKIDKQVNEVVKEAVYNALQAPLHERFRDLSEFQMKEILHDRMFESNSYRSHPDHTTLYEALELSMQRENNDELHAELTKSRKRRRDDQDPPPPTLKESNRSKKKKHDSDVSALKQPPVQKSSAWKTSDLREAPSSSSKQKPTSLAEQPVNDDPIQEDMHLLESEDTNAAYLPKIKTKPDLLKPSPEEKTPKMPKPDWVIPPNDLPETEKNWSDAMVKTYKYLKENKLLSKIGDMDSFIQWYCKQIRKKKLVKADFKGQDYKIVRPFHKNNICL